jgi:hypothetical protein
MSVRRYDPGLNETQAWERSAERNPPSRGRERAIERHNQITRGDGSKENASREKGGPFPLRDESDR